MRQNSKGWARIWLLVCTALLGLAPAETRAQVGGHGLLAFGEVYDHPGNYLTRATAASWTGPLAFSSNVYTRLDVALLRPLLSLGDALPRVGPDPIPSSSAPGANRRCPRPPARWMPPP